MSNSIKSFFQTLLLDIVNRRLGNRIIATIIVALTLVMSVELFLDLHFGKKDAIELMETLSMAVAALTY